ncbi:DNA-methyltransferase [Bacillus cabrialesii]|uniref:DNA-methyltransferase n=1 Tax=Bacillus cabrialesii TaxID=2487276 RepID=UPI0028F994A3|nr:site-specific DNA-methyltransferase [Bacillus cabrialesii]MDU0154028.1 site-specific DNA-methyltransferase [Bacillus cabrialesii]
MEYIDTILEGNCLDVLKQLPDETFNTCVTNPPYWKLRDYGVEGQLGHEDSPEDFISKLVSVFNEVKRTLKPDGTLWVNIGDTYAANRGSINRAPSNTRNKNGHMGAMNVPNGLKPKDMVGIPWRLALALQQDGWYLRSDIIWYKTNPLPESVRDRPTRSHEYIFLLSKSPRYYYDYEAIKEPVAAATKTRMKQNIENQKGSSRANGGAKTNGNLKAVGDGLTRNKRTVWPVSTKPFKDAHFATFPLDLIEPCIMAGCPSGGIVLDPFMGAGSTAIAALKLGRKFTGIELNGQYINEIANPRITTWLRKAKSH